MVKVVIKKRVCGRRPSDASWNEERKALNSLSAEKESHAYRETKAADIPVTYVSGRTIIRESGDTQVIIGDVAPRVKIISTK